MNRSAKKTIYLLKSVTALSLVATFFLGACAEGQPEETANETASLQGFELSSLDTTADPCTDFFQYVSGGWVKNNPIPETESRWGNFNVLQEANQNKMKGLLDSIAKIKDFDASNRYAQLISFQYTAGLDSAAIDEKGLAPAQPVLDRIMALKTLADYQKLLAEGANYGISGPLHSSVGVDDKNSDAYILNIYQSGLGLPDRDYYLKTDEASMKIQEQYREHIAKMLVMAGYDETRARTAASAIYKLEHKMAGKMMSRVDRRDPAKTYNKMGREQIVKMAPKLALDQYFSAQNLQFDSAIVAQPDYLKAVDALIANEPIQNLKDYHVFHFLSSTSSFLPSSFEQEDFSFYSTVLQGTKKMKPRYKRVISQLGGGLGEPLGRLFVDRYFPENAKQAVEQMVEDLRTAYGERIKQLDWMGDSTKERALEKLASFTYKIGYPEEWKSLAELELKPNNYFENMLAIARYQRNENLSKLGTEVDRSEWFMPAYLVNAYYNPSYNEIVFPAGILQPPFYDVNADAAINYGGIGGVIGHEFSHGFDDQGSKYDEKGNLDDWWTSVDRTNFDQRTGLMAEQYGTYEPLPDIHVNGELTLGENIADLGGLTMAYYGYQQRLKRMNEEAVVKDGFTWQQRIFLGWGQVWQTAQTDEYLKNQVMTDPHSPARYRVNGPVSNMPEFWEAWGCSEGDALVRTDSLQVDIW